MKKRFEHRVDECVERRHAVAVADSAGAEGWELVSVVPIEDAGRLARADWSSATPRGTIVDLYFKRELPPRQPTSEQVRTVRDLAQVGLMDARMALVTCDCDVERAVQHVTRVGLA
jgi:hypothetical protein